MKIFKVLFSRITLLALLILIQIALIVLVVYWTLLIPHVGWVVLGVLFLAQLVAFFILINRNDAPDMKVPWVALLFAIPLIGIFIYIFFANHGLTKKQNKRIEDIIEVMGPKVDMPYDKEDVLKEEHPEFSGITNYLNNATGFRGYFGNKITYFENGETFFPDMIAKLKEAKEFIFMEFFIVGYGKEWSQIEEVLKEKAKEGVKVKFMYDDFGCSSTLKRNFPKKMRKYGIETYRFNTFKPVLSGIFNNRDHRKICVIDHKYGYTGGINLADEYANDIVRFGYWKDSMIRIEGPAIQNLILLFFTTYDSNHKKLTDYEPYLKEDYKVCGESFALPFGDGPKPFYDEPIGEQTFINLFNAAKRSIYISSPYLIPTYSLIQALRNAALKGIDVKLVVPGIPDKKIVYLMAKNNFKTLLQTGVKIYTFTPGFNHEKAIVVDDEIAFIGTINLDYRSLIHHFECGAIIYKTDAVKAMSKSLLETMEKSYAVPQDYKLKGFKGFICKIVTLFAPLL